jgi:hypothetical protein
MRITRTEATIFSAYLTGDGSSANGASFGYLLASLESRWHRRFVSPPLRQADSDYADSPACSAKSPQLRWFSAI